MTEHEAEPPLAAELFGDRIELARSFADALLREGEERGLIGPLEPPRLWTRHIINCALAAPLLRPTSVADVGSGAGLPGLVLAIARPDARLVLIEPMERRVDWLAEQRESLGLDNVEIVRARAEEAVEEGPFEQVTARAVSALRTLIPLTRPLLRSGGEMIFLKGERVADEMGAAAAAIRKAKLVDAEILTLGEEFGTESTRVFRARVR